MTLDQIRACFAEARAEFEGTGKSFDERIAGKEVMDPIDLGLLLAANLHNLRAATWMQTVAICERLETLVEEVAQINAKTPDPGEPVIQIAN